MDLFEAMRTAGNTRKLKPDPVPEEIIYRVLDNARFAPSGRNLQGWRVILVQDAGIRRRLRHLYSQVWYTHVAPLRTPPGEPPEREHYADHLDQVPVQLVILVELAAITTTIDAMDNHRVNGGSSIYPFVQNILLGLRAEGLGAAFTTSHLAADAQMRELLRIPAGFELAGHIGVGWPTAPMPTRLTRHEVEAFATRDTFDGPPVTSS